jgi:hypothetical protein
MTGEVVFNNSTSLETGFIVLEHDLDSQSGAFHRTSSLNFPTDDFLSTVNLAGPSPPLPLIPH